MNLVRITDLNIVRECFEPMLAGNEHEQLLSLIASSGALLRGHFRLQSGLHAPYFLRFGQLAYRPDHALRIARTCASIPQLHHGRDTVVIGAETSARYLAVALANVINAQVALTKVSSARRPVPEVKRGTLEGAKHAIVVTDVITTGASIEPLVTLARDCVGDDLHVIAFASVGPDDASKAFNRLRTPGMCLMRGNWQSSRSAECRLCVEGTPLVPGFEFN